ncbi:MAG: extracellular solute-binding protein [Opitutaceae bacterium]|nr:extracellular solute-binding protein [Opitutaceae bacterium]
MKTGAFGKYLAIALLVLGFGYSGLRVWQHGREQADDSEVKVIRLAHWQLEPGVREAFDAIAQEYMRLHPQVKIEQLPIPGRVWTQWLRTQLVGGNPPDLIQVANYQITDEMLSRYFVPLTQYLEETNPYNADEPDLRELSWRRSFASELVPEETVHYYSANLLEYYAVPNAMVTVRIFYNRDILKAALGEDRVPRTFDEMIATCQALEDYARRTNQPILPLAGSIFNITKMTAGFFGGTTQQLAIGLDYSRDLNLTKFEGIITFLRGQWSVDTPAVRTSLETVSAIGRYMSPGWVQMNREDAMLQFLQGQAAMLSTGTWDAGGILQQAQFEVGAFAVPSISPDDPVFGAATLGPTSEANIFASLPFGMTQASRHPEIVIDFLRFMTSRRMNEKFAEISTWLPVIKGVEVPKVAEAFRPISSGFIPGLVLQNYGSLATNIFNQNVHLLSGANASAAAYVEKTRDIYPRVLVPELQRMADVHQETIRQKDSVMTGLYMLNRAAGPGRSRFDIVAAKQLEVEAQRLQSLQAIADYQAR